MVQVVVDAKAIGQLGRDIEKARRQLIGRLAERGYQLLREEIKNSAYETGNLLQGVAAPEVDYENSLATLTVSARSAATGSRSGKIIGADGKEKKSVTLSPQPAFNYAWPVARGRAAIRPKNGKALLIPVPSVSVGESYLLAGGQIFIFRRSASATKPNPFDIRAADQLEKEAPNIAEAVFKQFV